MFTAFDRVWLLVGLTLALVVSWTTLLGHLAIKLLDGLSSEQDFAGACCLATTWLARGATPTRELGGV